MFSGIGEHASKLLNFKCVGGGVSGGIPDVTAKSDRRVVSPGTQCLRLTFELRAVLWSLNLTIRKTIYRMRENIC